MNEVPISLLKPHPKNQELFPEKLPDDLWGQMITDIQENGIINPLIVAPDYTVLAGHLRLEAAKEAGLTHVPVVIRDVDPDSDEAVELLIKDNLLRRQLSDVQVARLIRVLKEKYGVKPGRPKSEAKENSAKMAELMGLPERTMRRLDKLNDLIPALQTLVAEGKLSQTAAYSLAFLPPEEQERLLTALGEAGVCGLSVDEAQELRRQVEAALKERDELAGKLAEARERELDLERQIASVQRQAEDLFELSALRKQLDALEEERDCAIREARSLREKLKHPQVVYQPNPEIEARIAKLDAAIKTKENELTVAREQLAAERERLEELHKKNAGLQEKLKAARGEASKLHESLNNYLRANAELKGHAITQETRFRAAITTAAKAIGEAVGRVKIEFREDFRHNKDLADRVHTLARHLQDAAQELMNLAALNGASSKTVDIEEGLTDVEVVDIN